MFEHFDKFFADHPEGRDYSDLVVMPPTADEAIEEWHDLEGSSLIKHPDEDSTFGVTRLALYIRARRMGQSHRFAEMIASQSPPRCMTDDVFFAGMQPWTADCTPQRKAKILAAAKAQGFTPSPDAIYHPGLARFPGDKEAFFTRSQGRGYIKQLCERRGWAAEGAVTVAARQPEDDMLAPKHCVPLSENIVREKAMDMIQENPGLKSLNRKQLREKVLERYGPTT